MRSENIAFEIDPQNNPKKAHIFLVKMETFNLHILGCGSALPTLHHNPSAQVVEIRGKLFLVDCGEGTQIALRRSHQRFTAINAVFISHLHGDHCLGLMGLISTFGLLGRTAPLHIYAPGDLEPLLEAEQKVYCSHLDYQLVFHAIDTRQSAVIYDDRSVSIETIPLEHRVPCCGFLFREKPTLPHIRREMIDQYQIPLCYINVIKNGASWELPDGTILSHEELTIPAAPARSYAYCSDTRYMPHLHERLKGVSLLYHEATYAADKRDNAAKYFHSTAAEAAQVAADAGAGRLILGHFSARYNDESVLLSEAQAIFPNTILAREGLSVEVL